MAGWTYTGAAYGVGTEHTNPDAARKALAFPTLASGNAGWWQDFAYKVGSEFADLTDRNSGAAATVVVSANNSSGDTNGVGVLTITLTVA